MRGVAVFAPAKVNLTLHVTGRRDDGYHLLDSLVAFAGVGDVLDIRCEGPGGLSVSGPEAAGVPTDARNLILQVAAAFRPPHAPISFRLDKRLPAAAGIGGGSADAAACFRGLATLRGEPAVQATKEAMAGLLSIGADVPMCVTCAPARVRGIGEDIVPVHGLPDLPVVLVNPRVAVPTGAVFGALERRDNPPMEDLPTDLSDRAGLLGWLARQRNDLEAPASARAPEIGQVLDALRDTDGCRLARMSGSGATCFALYDDDAAASASALSLRSAQPGWWVEATRLDGARHADPCSLQGAANPA